MVALLSRLMFVFAPFFSLRDYVTNKKTGQQLNKLFFIFSVLACARVYVSFHSIFSFELKHQIKNGCYGAFCAGRRTKNEVFLVTK